jgi:hypothetical protein
MFLVCLVVVYGCKEVTENKVSPILIQDSQLDSLLMLPLKCLRQEYPNKLNQILANELELGGPKALHPAFYGCFDWHSAVHGHWLLVRGLRMNPNHPWRDTMVSILQEHISPENIQIELDYFKRKSERGFERTYGWAWLLKLGEELLRWEDPVGAALHETLQPLIDYIIEAYLDYLPKLAYPIRGGEHTNTAFGLRLALEYALLVEHDQLAEMIRDRAVYFYQDDKNCPLDWEPSGYDFLSPCLEELYLMSMVLEKPVFRKWAKDFLPSLFDPVWSLIPAMVSDRTDGKLVHLDGLNFSRAWCLYGISNQMEDAPHLVRIANEHFTFSIRHIFDNHYSGEHWLASFALLALGHSLDSKQ